MSVLLNGVRFVTEGVRSNSDNLNRLDAIAGDGDLGVTVGIAATAVIAGLPELEPLPIPALLSTLGGIIARKAPSTSGTLIASGLLRAGRDAQPIEAFDSAAVARLIESAATAIAERGGAAPGAKTMLDALVPASQAASEAAQRGGSIADVFDAAARASAEGVEATKAMRPLFGRAGWLSERSLGTEDAGAKLIEIIFTLAAKFAREQTT